MGLHRGPGLHHHRRRDIPRAGPRQQEATPRDGPAPGTRPPPSQEARHPTGRPPPKGGEPRDAERDAVQLLQQEATIPHGEVSRQQAPNRAMRSETPPKPRHTEARRDTPVVTHPTPTAARDDLTPRSPIQVLPQAGTI
jgi:hypothetical protein